MQTLVRFSNKIEDVGGPDEFNRYFHNTIVTIDSCEEEEYNGKTIVKLSFPKFKFCNAIESKLDVFDKTNQWHYKPLQNKSIEIGRAHV